MMQQYQWMIYWASLTPSIGSEQAGRRPVLIISAEEANEFLPVVTIISLTSMKPGRKLYPTEALLPSTDTGLSQDSIAMAHQIRSISKERLDGTCGRIESEQLKLEIRKAITTYLDLTNQSTH
ncbi:MAG: type II toxin-antitoxin system PemK/MazF family toxin [Paenibacillaceae bacterium]